MYFCDRAKSHQYVKTSKALTMEVATNANKCSTHNTVAAMTFTGPVGSSPKAFQLPGPD